MMIALLAVMTLVFFIVDDIGTRKDGKLKHNQKFIIFRNVYSLTYCIALFAYTGLVAGVS